MEEEIQEKLQEIYNFTIEVKFIDFRKYEIYCKPLKDGFCLPILYDGKMTLEANITNASMKIDREILKMFKKGE